LGQLVAWPLLLAREPTSEQLPGYCALAGAVVINKAMTGKILTLSSNMILDFNDGHCVQGKQLPAVNNH
jgi:hypothetical protein